MTKIFSHAMIFSLMAFATLTGCKSTSQQSSVGTSTFTPLPPKESKADKPSTASNKDWLELLLDDQQVGSQVLTKVELERWRLEYDQQVAQYPYFNTISFDEYLQASGKSLSDLSVSTQSLTEERKRSLKSSTLSALSSQLIQETVEQSITVSEEQVRNLYNSRVNEYKAPESVRIRLLLVATQDEADSLMSRLKTGDDFSELAREFSLHSSRDQGGELPSFVRGTYSEEIESSAFLLGTGEIGMAKSSRGNFLIQKISGTPGKTVPFASIKSELRNELELEAKRNALKAMINS